MLFRQDKRNHVNWKKVSTYFFLDFSYKEARQKNSILSAEGGGGLRAAKKWKVFLKNLF